MGGGALKVVTVAHGDERGGLLPLLGGDRSSSIVTPKNEVREYTHNDNDFQTTA